MAFRGAPLPPRARNSASSLSFLPGLPEEPRPSPQIPAPLLLTRKNPASILPPRSEIAPYPRMQRAVATEGGTGEASGAPGRSSARRDADARPRLLGAASARRACARAPWRRAPPASEPPQ